MIAAYLPLSMGGGIQCLQITANYQDLQATSGAGAKTINVTDAAGNAIYIPAGAVVAPGVRVKPVTAFAGGSLSALTMSVGKTGTATYLTAAYDVFAAVSDSNQQETSKFASGQATHWQPTLVFTPTGAACSAATAGEVDIQIYILAPSTP